MTIPKLTKRLTKEQQGARDLDLKKHPIEVENRVYSLITLSNVSLEDFNNIYHAIVEYGQPILPIVEDSQPILPEEWRQARLPEEWRQLDKEDLTQEEIEDPKSGGSGFRLLTNKYPIRIPRGPEEDGRPLPAYRMPDKYEKGFYEVSIGMVYYPSGSLNISIDVPIDNGKGLSNYSRMSKPFAKGLTGYATSVAEKYYLAISQAITMYRNGDYPEDTEEEEVVTEV